MRPKLQIGRKYIVEFYDNKGKHHKSCLIYLGIDKKNRYVWTTLGGLMDIYLREGNCFYFPCDGEVYEAN